MHLVCLFLLVSQTQFIPSFEYNAYKDHKQIITHV